MYKDLGFKRVVLGREASLAEIREIKDAVPEMELEVFAHGAMCISYSGRCLMSAYLTGRSANAGWCSHSCRWNFNLSGNNDFLTEPLTKEEARAIAQSGKLFITEHERPNEHFPIFEGEDFTAILSSKDLCMVDHLDKMKEAGVDEIMLDGIFIDRDEYSESIQCFMDVLGGADASEKYISMKQKNDAVSEGYMYTRTNLLKTEGEGR
jgi:putative protease